MTLRGSCIKMSWPFCTCIIDHISARAIYQRQRGAEITTMAPSYPILIPERGGGMKKEREREKVTLMQQPQHALFFCFFYEKHLYLGSLIARDVFHPLISMHCEIKIHPSSFYRPGPENEVKMKKMNSFP